MIQVNLGSISTIAANVFREVIRDRTLYLVALYALILLAAVLLLPEVAAGTQDKMTLDIGLGAMNILGLIVTVFIGTGLINKEIEKRTVLVLISKPVGRGEFVVGKFLGLSAVLAVLIAVMTAIFILVLKLNEIPFPLGSILVASLYLFFQLSLIVAVAIIFGVFASSLLATLLTFSIYLMGHFSRDLLQLAEVSDNASIQPLAKSLYLILPDLARLDVKNGAVYGSAALPEIGTLLLNALYGSIYTILLLSVATVVFSRREF
ncbi:ABC transporter permease [Oscillatoriales cyanobacterium LEGE 11467]|uniref:ABC transporter permease n=1 Tax=Zarconia navalis LEGE 11467 TaxID=1828826 RepID=A0A928W1B5_9CYAN|nr:ABC transporter permease [Zarconia navalis]MBE9042707.1 ABC transporter permease [Zarconia navalis LEGE 11467]